ncbi:MAG: hypothetical protein EBR79_00720 [Proteobacteria bacterium]|nr:hypothetical protein [Pseudomonadota bacterium]NBX86331.1 hypothetical protein [Pseudomonadota bacterium]
MAKIGLAAQLAKQAAQAAREEVLAAEQGSGGGAGAGGSTGAAKPWVLEAVPDNFSLQEALQRATGQVAAHYRQILQLQGLQVQVVGEGGRDGAVGPQPVPDFVANVREGETGRVVRAYTAPDLLTMFASQQQLNGVVVDGKV